jgi:Response regulator containing CheY-like receiver, AAA-type ATPase, and DNA-binding domains
LNNGKGIKERAIAKAEQSFLENVLKLHQGDIKKAADDMGVTSRAIYIKLKKYGINLADYRKTGNPEKSS